MIGMNNKNFTEAQLDVLGEIINIGGGNAATSISDLFSAPTRMDVPRIEFFKYSELYETIMSEGSIVEAVLINVSGDGKGVFLYIIEEKDTLDILEKLLPEGIEVDEELKNSTLKELANILVNAFLSATVKMLDVELYSSLPHIAIDMFGAILSSVYIETGQCDDDIMIIKNYFSLNGKRVNSSLYFIPEPGVLEDLFKKLGI